MSTPPSDPQSRAYREAGPGDRWDGDLQAIGARVSQADDVSAVVLPEDYEDTGWDTGRVGPKSLEEAREALASRIADPHAPDSEAEAGAYDEGGV